MLQLVSESCSVPPLLSKYLKIETCRTIIVPMEDQHAEP